MKFKNLCCPKCDKHVVYKKFLFIEPNKRFDCMYCETPIVIKSKYSDRVIMYFFLLLFVPLALHGAITQSAMTGSIAIIMMIAFVVFDVKTQYVDLQTSENIK